MARDYNLAMLAHGFRRLETPLTQKRAMKVLAGKHMNEDDDFMHARTTGLCSSNWRGIAQTRPFLKKGLKWNVGNGTNVNFWFNWWVGEGPLVHARSHAHLPFDANSTVSNFILDNGEWDLDSLAAFLPPAKLDEIRAVPCGLSFGGEDTCYLGVNPSGFFSVGSAYRLLSNEPNIDPALRVDWIWRLRCPERVRFFLWVFFQKKLNTNELRV